VILLKFIKDICHRVKKRGTATIFARRLSIPNWVVIGIAVANLCYFSWLLYWAITGQVIFHSAEYRSRRIFQGS
jgi:hypothetical protein